LSLIQNMRYVVLYDSYLTGARLEGSL
jgi:hypothetical protein